MAQTPFPLANPTPAEWASTPEPVKNLLNSLLTRASCPAADSLYQRAVFASADSIFVVDCNYVYQMVNPAYLAWYDTVATEVIGRSLSQVLGLEQFQQHLQPHLERCLAGATVKQEGWHDYPSGRKFVSIAYTPALEPDGTVSGVLVSACDLTSLKQAELALSHREHRFRTLVENSTDVIIILDRRGNFCYTSPSIQTVLGYAEADVAGKSALDLIHPDEQEASWQTLELALNQPNVSLPTVECQVRHANGTWRVFEANVRNLLYFVRGQPLPF